MDNRKSRINEPSHQFTCFKYGKELYQEDVWLA